MKKNLLQTTTHRFVLWLIFVTTLFATGAISAQEICGNGMDNDGDGVIDCEDADCNPFVNYFSNPSMEAYSQCPNLSIRGTIDYADNWSTTLPPPGTGGQLMVNDTTGGCISPRPANIWPSSTNMSGGSDGLAWLGMHVGEDVQNTLTQPLPPGTYTFSFNAGYVVNSPFFSGGRFEFYGVEVGDPDFSINNSLGFSPDITNQMSFDNQDWQSYSFTFTSTQSFDRIFMIARSIPGNSNSFMYFDEFSVSQFTPEIETSASCEIILVDPDPNIASWDVYRDGAFQFNTSDDFFSPYYTGTYHVVGRTAGGCESVSSNTVVLPSMDCPDANMDGILDGPEICDNGIDDDGDGFVDAFDPDCPCNEDDYGNYVSRCAPDCQYEFVSQSFAIKEQWSSVPHVGLSYATSLVADIDNDGQTEVIALSSTNSSISTRTSKDIFILNGDDGNLEMTITTPYMEWSASLAFAVADVDHDGYGEIIIASSSSVNPAVDSRYLFCYEHDGTLKWKSDQPYAANTPSNRTGGAPGLADFNHDGIAEIYIYNEIFNAETGVKLADGGANGLGFISGFGNVGNSVAADFLPNTAALELACGNTVYQVDITNTTGMMGNTMSPIQIPGYPDGQTSAADIDNDGVLDVIVSPRSNTQGLYVWSPVDITLIAEHSTFSGTNAGLAFIGDVDNDGDSDIGYCRPFNLYMLSYDGTTTLAQKWVLPTTDDSGMTGLSMFDFNQDGQTEIVYRDENTLRIIDGSAAAPVILASIASFSGTANEMPVVADINNDGQAEIVIGSAANSTSFLGYYKAYRTDAQPWAPAREVWNQQGYHNTNIRDDLTIPLYQQNHALVFFDNLGMCAGATPRPLNNYLQQAAPRDRNGCLIYPAADGVVRIDTFICYSADSVKVTFTVTNQGDVALDSLTPIRFYENNPLTTTGYKFPDSAVVGIALEKESSIQLMQTLSLDSVGSTFKLYITINDDGDSPRPFMFPTTSIAECDYTRNLDSVTVFCPMVDTVSIIIPMDSTYLVCGDTMMLSGEIASVEICDAANGTVVPDGFTGCVEYIPDAGFVGLDTTCIIVCDTDGICDTTIVTIRVVPPPDTVPVITPMDSTFTVCADMVMLSGEITSVETCDAANGTVVPDGLTGCVEYTPDVGFVGLDTTCIIVCDDNGICDTTVVTITVVPPPDTISVITPMDSTFTVCAEMVMLSGEITSVETCDAANGTVVPDGLTGCIEYTPDAGFVGLDTTCIIVCDENGICDTTIVTIRVVPPPDTVPVITPMDSTFTVCADMVMLSGEITSVETCDAANGTVVPDGLTGCVEYTPDVGFVGLDTTCIIVCDDNGICDTTVVTITVVPPPDTISVTTPMDSTFTVCAEMVMLSGEITSVETCDAANGTVVPDGLTGCIEYTPDAGFVGLDTTCIIVCDENGICDTTVVTITVVPPLDTISVTTPMDSTFTVCAEMVMLSGEITSVETCDAANGTVVPDGLTGCIEYTPDVGFVGLDTTCIIVCDENGICDTSVVTITVVPPPDTISVITPMDSTFTVCADMVMLSGEITSVETCDAANGTVVPDGLTGCIEYTPDAGFVGLDTTCIIVCDADGICDTTIVTITVVPPPDTISVITPMDSTFMVCGDMTMIPGEIVSVETCEPGNGSVTPDGLTGCIEYTPDAGFVGLDTTCIIVCDENGICDTTVVTIAVGPPSDTVMITVPVDSSMTVCVDTTMLSGNLESIISCGDPMMGTLANFDLFTACVDYMAPSTAGIRDTFCIVICDDVGICDTTIIFVEVPVDVSVVDPCNCEDEENYLQGGIYYFHERIEIMAPSGETVILDPVLSQNLYDDAGMPITTEIVVPEDAPGIYALDVWVQESISYVIAVELSNGITGQTEGVCTDPCFDPCPPTNCHGRVNLSFGTDCEILVTADMLLIQNGLAQAFPDQYRVELTDGNGIVIPGNILRPEHVGREIRAKVTLLLDACGVGSCESIIVLDKPDACIIRNTLDTVVYCIDPFLALDPMDPAYPKPDVTSPCSTRELKLELSPDWITPIACDEENDTAEIIYREWTATTAGGERCTGVDTIVVFRLPKLTPEAFVDPAEDSFYCELEPVSQDGEVLKRYASWKQPIGLHDYELPYTKLRGVTYEIPATIILAGLTNAASQGEEVYEQYLACVILRKADGSKVTIGDIVGGDYMDDLLANASQEQLTYGFLQAVIELNEKPLNVILEAGFDFYPYLLLQSGDWILSEGGQYEQVDQDWFYVSAGASAQAGSTSPYWFAGGWPSIYGSGTCVRYCDVGIGDSDTPGGCIRIRVPLLDKENGFSEECDTICLSTGVHCGITIRQDLLTAWTQTHTGKLGTGGNCPQTRGRDTWITQTCWAETPNHCVSDSEIPCGDLNAEENNDDAVVDYECSDKAVKIHLSQWQTLYDTLGPVFDFCYPADGSIRGCEGIQDDIVWIWDDTQIREAIRQGRQYGGARAWESCNPTTYRVNSHDCEAEVFVPDVQVIDNCSGIHSVKAMVDVSGGTRAVTLERTVTATKVLANGDSCYVHTYSHTTNPIHIPYSGCDGELTQVRYEASDNCWNQSTWSKFIRIIDDVPPTVVVNREVNVPLQNKIAWAHAETFDEGSWDNCSIDLRLARRADWWADTTCVNLCDEIGPNAPYDNWVDLLDDLGVDRNQAISAVGGEVVGEDHFNAAYQVDDLARVLNEGEVEEYYFDQIVWLWEDAELCGRKVVHGWLYAIAENIAENCSEADEHGNLLNVKDLEAIFDNLTGKPGYGQEIAYLGGGWSQSVPFKCTDVCQEVVVELAVFDNCCNWTTGWSTVQVEDKGQSKLVKRLPDLDITCEAYNSFYKDIVENAAALGEKGSTADSTGIFAALDEAWGGYVLTWVDNQNRPVDLQGRLITPEELNFDYRNVSCSEKSTTERIAVPAHDGQVDWVNQVTKTTFQDTAWHTGTHGIVGINCSGSSVQDVWLDLDECGNGTITRRFLITSGCGTDATPIEVRQVIRIASDCALRESMFDLPSTMGSSQAPVCLQQSLSDAYFPDTLGSVKLKSHLAGALCNSLTFGKEIKELTVQGSTNMRKYQITWLVKDWCGTHTDGSDEFTFTQEVVATIDPACNIEQNGTSGNGIRNIIDSGDRVWRNSFELYQNYPNPFEGYTVIGFELPEAMDARLTIYDVTGKVLYTIVGSYGKGYNEVEVSPDELSITGVLFYQLETDKYMATKRMVREVR